ncbi:MAG: hypothetical protein AVDCRST_MAG29-31 [uncultured Nocardioidaceae bacterium]|uniref:Uncharacterized protein n=1 Tax=uncultured Nocardioidaceae bacterium TaxID=253824 RepID=A0A6J4KUG0_9ACTN|nr:MAG: hypothetical protein AVDCRST_MAG29-31 [uncultured Nocardioidaceae bacterium]
MYSSTTRQPASTRGLPVIAHARLRHNILDRCWCSRRLHRVGIAPGCHRCRAASRGLTSDYDASDLRPRSCASRRVDSRRRGIAA